MLRLGEEGVGEGREAEVEGASVEKGRLHVELAVAVVGQEDQAQVDRVSSLHSHFQFNLDSSKALSTSHKAISEGIQYWILVVSITVR